MQLRILIANKITSYRNASFSDRTFFGQPHKIALLPNPHGVYGGQHGLYSISNPHGMYGGQHGLYSPYNSYCLNPPIIYYQGQPIVMVTRNSYVQTNGLQVIDPDLLIIAYTQAKNSPTFFYADAVQRMFQAGG